MLEAKARKGSHGLQARPDSESLFATTRWKNGGKWANDQQETLGLTINEIDINRQHI